jgi:hypothetical protein
MMAKFNQNDGLPPPSSKGRRGPEMMKEDPSIYSKLSKIAQGGGADEGSQGGMGGMPGMGGGGEGEASQHLMNGIQELIAAAKAHPQLGQLIMPLLQQLRSGMEGLGGGGMEESSPEMNSQQSTKKRKGPPKRERGNDNQPQPDENMDGSY